MFVMNAVYATAVDPRNQRLLVSATSEHWGPSVFTSDDPQRLRQIRPFP